MECCHSILLSILCDTPGKRNPFQGYSLFSKAHSQWVLALLQFGILSSHVPRAFLIDFKKKY